jgi:NAD(P)-dependent dehydrogenase (short-subunit alcohol dehydrogenase family)
VSGRLADKVAVVTGAGQSAGQGIGNGRATAIAFAREGVRGSTQRLKANRRGRVRIALSFGPGKTRVTIAAAG